MLGPWGIWFWREGEKNAGKRSARSRKNVRRCPSGREKRLPVGGSKTESESIAGVRGWIFVVENFTRKTSIRELITDAIACARCPRGHFAHRRSSAPECGDFPIWATRRCGKTYFVHVVVRLSAVGRPVFFFLNNTFPRSNRFCESFPTVVLPRRRVSLGRSSQLHTRYIRMFN